MVIGVAGGIFTALLITVIAWFVVKRKKLKSAPSLPRRKPRNKNKPDKKLSEKKSWPQTKIFFTPPTKADLDECIVPSEPFKYYPQTDYCSVTDVDPDSLDPDLYK